LINCSKTLIKWCWCIGCLWLIMKSTCSCRWNWICHCCCRCHCTLRNGSWLTEEICNCTVILKTTERKQSDYFICHLRRYELICKYDLLLSQQDKKKAKKVEKKTSNLFLLFFFAFFYLLDFLSDLLMKRKKPMSDVFK
jgi:hypothetical protein